MSGKDSSMIKSKFGLVLRNFVHGVVRVSSDLKLVDKNPAAEKLLLLPRRGSNIGAYIKDGGKCLVELEKRYGSVTPVVFKGFTRDLIAFAFREDSKNILILFEPILSAYYTSCIKKKVPRVVSFYSRIILSILTDADTKGECHYACGYLGNILSYDEDGKTKFFYNLEHAIPVIDKKLRNIDFTKTIIIVFGKFYNPKTTFLDMRAVQYLLSELLLTLELYGANNKASIYINQTEDSLCFTVRDKLSRKITKSDGYYARIVTEILRLINVESEIKLSKEGELVFFASVPIVHDARYVHIPQPLSEEEMWGFLNYCLDYFGYGKNT